MVYKPDRTWAEVDLDSLIHNYKEFVRITEAGSPAKRVKIMAVVKAGAYGHGAVTVAKTLTEAGADHLAVATLDEAIELRGAGITSALLVLSYVAPQRHGEVLKHDIISTVYQQETALALSGAASKHGRKAKVHIKTDTGMTRVGLNWEHAAAGIGNIYRMPGLEVEGLFTHFASADEQDPGYTEMQFERYMRVVEQTEKLGIEIPIKHVCNSAAAINYPHMHLDMIRPGISLYGCYPAGEQGAEKQKIDLKPVMSLKTEVIRVNEVGIGTPVSYGRTFTANRKSRLVTLPVGYADGFSRMLSGKACVLIKGHKAPMAGRICMDQCVADITDVPSDVSVGDEAVLLGRQGASHISADDVASQLGTINYEVLCMVAKRVPRYYWRRGEMVSRENYLV